MNILHSVVRVCRAALNSAPAFSRTFSSLTLKPLTLDNTLEAVARVLCVHSRGVIVCGPAGVSVAHFPSPRFSCQENTL